MGACIAMRIALSHQPRTSALILMASTSEPSNPEASAATGQMRDIWASTPSPSEEIMDIGIRSWGGDQDVNGPRAHRVKSDWKSRHSGAENVDSILQSVDQRENLLSRVHEFTVPVLLVHGEKDETWKLEGALRIRDAIGKDKAEIYIVQNSGHLVIYMRESEDVSQIIAKFLKQIRPQYS
jgi:pimeloyl-ACP methyl ester carboxylesterase